LLPIYFFKKKELGLYVYRKKNESPDLEEEKKVI